MKSAERTDVREHFECIKKPGSSFENHVEFPSFLPPITPGLYLVGVPIGNRGDISLRALFTLTHVHTIYCEDTRVSRVLLDTYGIRTPLKSYHEHNADKVRPHLLQDLKNNQSIALISDAGMPLISDPGFKLVHDCQQHHIPVTCVPGPSAVLTGLVLSGMPSDQFFYAGFVSKKNLPLYQPIPSTLIFFESPHRLLETLKIMSTLFQDRQVAVARELTKKFEEVVQGEFTDVIDNFRNREKILGEFVIILSPPNKALSSQEQENVDQKVEQALKEALKTHRLKDACTLVAGAYGLSKKEVYARALLLKK